MQSLESILRESAKRHKHLCPRQVLGARMSLLAGEILGLELPRVDKRPLVIAEADGCTVDGIIAATGCHVGSRTLRTLDFGKIAATFVDTHTERSIRLVPRAQARLLSRHYAPTTRGKSEIMLLASPAAEFLIGFAHRNASRQNGVSSARLVGSGQASSVRELRRPPCRHQH